MTKLEMGVKVAEALGIKDYMQIYTTIYDKDGKEIKDVDSIELNYRTIVR